MVILIFLAYILIISSYYFCRLNDNLKDGSRYIAHKGEDIFVVESQHGYYFITRTKNLYFENKAKAIYYLFSKGYIPFR